ncbi:hypothetical protein [Fusibacter sp. JL216-2]|uniref:hypothetical protein n=1 Tax=Fusibacter sp. JL216-2 TaxID=3071453 RepID=UPI003D3594B3
MRFHYPHRLYAMGLVLLILILIYGLVVLYDIGQEGHLPALFVPFYGILSILLGRFYYKYYMLYKTKYVDVYMDYMEFCSDGMCIHIDEDDILGIYFAKHRQMLKIFRVLHIFSKDGTYVYITNEINQYNRLITLMQYYYPSHFKICKSLIKGVQNIDINLLENHIRAPHPPK